MTPGAPAPANAFEKGHLAALAGLRAAVSAGVLIAGFRAVSDDDYARVVIAEAWAHAPKLDPSGTSWLPFPFWLNGAAMLAFGRSLFVAQAVAFLLGIASTLVVAIGALRVTGDRRAAWMGAGLATLLGWSAWLGVATVPECLTAALTFFAAASLATGSLRDRALGGIALVAATLSRYEPWPVAIVFAAWNVIDLHFRWTAAVSAGHAPGRARAVMIATSISATALAGPVAWIAWNRLAHGDEFHFVARVTAYRKALGEATNESVLARLIAYPVALVREMPEVAVPFVIAVLLALVPRLRAAIVMRLRRNAGPLALAAVQMVALAMALVKDGAPTHHPERAMLFPALAMAVFVGDVAAGLVAEVSRARPPLRERSLLASLVGVGLFVRAVVTPLVAREGFAHRGSEVEVGALVAANVPVEARVMLQAPDYGYFAIEAASGRPESFELDRNIDPRDPVEAPNFAGNDDYVAWLRGRRADWLVSIRDEKRPLGWRFPPGESFTASRHTLSKVPVVK